MSAKLFDEFLNPLIKMFGMIGSAQTTELRYGENPHQQAILIRFPTNRPGVTTAIQLHGKELSYNNINDTDAAYECVAEFREIPACAIIKHATPCGVAVGKRLADAYTSALECDKESAFGGIVALNQELDASTARIISEIFTEVIIAPSVSEEAKQIIGKKKDLRLLSAGGVPNPKEPGLAVRSVAGGLLVQTRDAAPDDTYRVVSKREPTADEMRDMKFAWRVAKHVKSNAVVYARNCSTIGIGAGQMSRVDSSRIAERKLKVMESQIFGEVRRFPPPFVAASDAFFPFADGILTCIQAGARAVIQPGGSKRDDEVIKAADDHNVAMVFTGTRHFRH